MDRQTIPQPAEVTDLFVAAREGDESAVERMIPLVSEDLRIRAHRQLERERGSHTLRPIDLVREAFSKHAPRIPDDVGERAQFLAITARAMRKMLVDHARRRRSARRGAGWQRTTLSDDHWVADFEPHELLALDAAIEGLEQRQRTVVECRFFGGMCEAEIARALGVSERTVRRDWVKARAWLYCKLYGAPPC